METSEKLLLIVLVMCSFALGWLIRDSEVKEEVKYNVCQEYFSHSENYALPFPDYVEVCL